MASLITRQTAGANCTVQGSPLTNATIDGNLIAINNELVATVHNVTGSAPVVSSGGTTPAISMAAASASVNGYMTSTYASKLDGISAGATANLGTITSVTGSAPVVSSGGTTPAISMAAASASVNGYMSAVYASKLDGIPAGAASAGANGYMSAVYASKLDGISAGATNISNTNQLTNGAGYITAGGSCNYANSAGSAGSSSTSTKASTLAQNGGSGSAMTFNWAGQVGQPTWLWGSNDGINHYVWNPANFSVNYATTATTAYYAASSDGPNFYVGGISNAVLEVGKEKTGNNPSYIQMYSGANGAYKLQMVKYAGDSVFRIFNNSTVYGVELAKANYGWSQYSDERLKNIIEPIENASEKVSTLRAVIGNYKLHDKRTPFLIAQDVVKVLPEAISYSHIYSEDGEQMDDIEYMSLEYTALIPLLTAAIKEQRIMIKALSDRIEVLENK